MANGPITPEMVKAQTEPSRFAEWQEDTYGNRMDSPGAFLGWPFQDYVEELANRCAAYQDHLREYVVRHQ